jgi:hypothetical protein
MSSICSGSRSRTARNAPEHPSLQATMSRSLESRSGRIADIHRTADPFPGIPQPARLGIFHSRLRADSRRSRWNPPTGKVGDLSLQPKRNTRRAFLESHNRKVVDPSLQPTKRHATRPFLESHNRKVVDLSLQPTSGRPTARAGIPQPERLGIVHSSLQANSRRGLQNPPTGKVGDRSL